MTEVDDAAGFELPAGAARTVRPMTLRRLSFEDLFDRGIPGTYGAGRYLVPAESAARGDTQVLAAREPGRPGTVVNLDHLAELGSVESVVTTATLEVTKPLPSVRELLCWHLAPRPTAATLANLPKLEAIHIRWCLLKGPLLDLAALPHPLGRLALSSMGISHLSTIGRFHGLQSLELDLGPTDALDPVGGLSQLRRLKVDGGKGWKALAGCDQLEVARLADVRLANLRPWNRWSGLRRLTLSGPGLGSLDGIGAFIHLECCALRALRIDNLSPLSGLSELAEVRMAGLTRGHDISPLGQLKALRVLEISQLGVTDRDTVHVDSLRPLATATSLEELLLEWTVVDDGDLSPLAELPALRVVRLHGHYGDQVEELRSRRPQLDITHIDLEAADQSVPSPAPGGAGDTSGGLVVHPPDAQNPNWWLFENVTDLLGVDTNYDAEESLRRGLSRVDNGRLLRLDFDTEAGGLGVQAVTESDMTAVVEALRRLAQGAGHN